MSIFAHVFPEINLLPDNTYMNKRDIKDVLTELMKLRSVTQTYVAEKSDVPQPTISRILRGTHNTLEIDTARKLADFFHVSIDQLIGNEPLDNDRQWFEVKKAWRSLADDKKEVVETTIKVFSKAKEIEPESAPKNTGRKVNHGGHHEANSAILGKSKRNLKRNEKQ
jgi:transcriptional regulator with XRE-family HTH domain